MALVVAQLLLGLVLIGAGVPVAAYVNRGRTDTAGGRLAGITMMVVGLVFVASSLVILTLAAQPHG